MAEATVELSNDRRSHPRVAQNSEEIVNGGGAKTGMPKSEDGEEITVNAFLPPQVPSGSVSKTER